MKRLTTDHPEGNFETMLNFVYSEKGWAHIRHDGERDNVPLHEWARTQCLRRCGEFPESSPEEIDETICGCLMDFPACPIALAYCFASQAVHLRDRLKQYEDILYDASGAERVSLAELKDLAGPNAPLTLEELGKMAGEPVWVESVTADGSVSARWMLIDRVSKEFDLYLLRPARSTTQAYTGESYGKTWLAYRRRPKGVRS